MSHKAAAVALNKSLNNSDIDQMWIDTHVVQQSSNQLFTFTYIVLFKLFQK
jgi:hypothetical protein